MALYQCKVCRCVTDGTEADAQSHYREFHSRYAGLPKGAEYTVKTLTTIAAVSMAFFFLIILVAIL